MYNKVTAGIQVTDADMLKYYNDNKNQFVDPEQVKARQILVKTEDEAKAIITQLNAGANFADLAKAKSTDTGAKDTGGELGYFSKGEMVPEFEQAAFSQKVGTWSQTPVKTQFGYHIILVEDHKAQVQKTYDQVKSDIQQTLPQKMKDDKFQQYLDSLKKQAKIEYATGYGPSTSTQPSTTTPQ